MIIHLLPEIHAKVRKREPKRKTINGHIAHGNPKPKYDHWQMIQDRISGMSWLEIGRKHGVVCTGNSLMSTTQQIVENSSATLKMSPDEVRRYEAAADKDGAS